MGAYLSEPNKEKNSVDEFHKYLDFGVSGMQGWRMSMEDAHCCIADLTSTAGNSLFGVFDGHGGKEVAQYCAQNFHKFLLDTEAFEEGNTKLALKQAFLNIDAALICDEVISELKALGGLEGEDDEEEDETELLLKEANMPLNELLANLKGNVKEEFIGLHNKLNAKEVENDIDERKSRQLPRGRSPERETTECENDEACGSSSCVSGSQSNQEDQKTSNEEGSSKSCYVDEEDKEDKDFDVINEEENSEEESESDEEFEDAEGVEFEHGSDEVGKDSGTTAVIALIRCNVLYVANAGDSRCVLCRGGKAIDMSVDHKPEDELERRRIELAGAKITSDGRVNGGLNLSRAIGDHAYKQNKDISPEEQAITACPDIQFKELTAEDSFMVLACDGIWNMMSSEEVVEFVQERISNTGKSLSKICEELFDKCLAPNTENDGSGCDNMTCLIVQFKHNGVSASVKRTNSQQRDVTQTLKKRRVDDA